jgi:Fe-S cluster assembly iron-binding protein IscA
LVLDEPKEEDRVFEYESLKMIITNDLLDELGSVNVDYSDSAWKSGFSISSSNTLRGAGGGGCC